MSRIDTLSHLRSTDAEREAAAERLTAAYADGRLDRAEFDLRLHLAMTAKTRGELTPLVADLVAPGGASGGASGGAFGRAPRGVAARAPVPVHGRIGAADRLWAMLSHWSGLGTLFVGPLVIALTVGRRSEYVRRQALRALDFQITFVGAFIALGFVAVVTLGLGALLYIPLLLGWFALTAGAGVAALAGSTFSYPYSLRVFH